VLRWRVGVIVAALAAHVAAPAAASPAVVRRAVRPASPPRLINIVRTRLKPRAAPAYSALEAQIARGYERARARVYWIGLQSPRDAGDVLYLNLMDSREAWNRMSADYDAMIKDHPEIDELQRRLRGLTASSSSTLTTRRDDVDRSGGDADFQSMRMLRLTMIEVQPGREGEFLNAIRTAAPKDGSWLVYEANESSTYALITLKRRALTRRDGPAIPRSLRRFRGVLKKVETRIYEVRPAWSHPRPAAGAAH
jgi:hypothetical protein